MENYSRRARKSTNKKILDFFVFFIYFCCCSHEMIKKNIGPASNLSKLYTKSFIYSAIMIRIDLFMNKLEFLL